MQKEVSVTYLVEILTKLFTNKNYSFYVVALLLVSMFSECPMGSQKTIPEEYKSFFELSKKEQCKEFRNYPLDKQFDIAIINRSRSRPPNELFFAVIASEGKEALPFLLNKLQIEKDEYIQEHIINILSIMTVDYYKLDDRKEIFELIKTTTSNMKNSAIKHTCTIYLEQMEKFKGKPPFFRETLQKEPC